MAIKVVTAPTVEPVSLAEAKAHLRILENTDDAYIDVLVKAAREACEHELGRSIAPQTLLLTLDAFPSGAIMLPRPQVSAIEFVKYLDASGALQTYGSINYWLDNSGELEHWAMPVSSWPTTGSYANAVQVQYQAGWASVPALVKQWILLMISTMYENRESSAERALTQNHHFFDRLLDRYAIPGL